MENYKEELPYIRIMKLFPSLSYDKQFRNLCDDIPNVSHGQSSGITDTGSHISRGVTPHACLVTVGGLKTYDCSKHPSTIRNFAFGFFLEPHLHAC